MSVNKVEYAGKVLLDLTEDTVTADMMESGVKAHDKIGALITGSIPVNDKLTYAAINESDLDYIKTHTSYGEICVVAINSTIYPKNEEKMILKGQEQRCKISIIANYFGSARPADVRKGITFTSENGLKITGTADMSGGTSDNNCEAYLVDVTNPTVSFKTASGVIKAYGYAYETTKSQWGGSSTTVYAFNGTNYYKSAYYGSPAATNITLGISGGKLTGLPSGLSGGTLLVVRGI